MSRITLSATVVSTQETGMEHSFYNYYILIPFLKMGTRRPVHDEDASPMGTEAQYISSTMNGDEENCFSEDSNSTRKCYILFSFQRGESFCLFYILKANLGMLTTERQWKFCHLVTGLSSNTDKAFNVHFLQLNQRKQRCCLKT